MHSDISFSRFKQFPALLWILMFGAFITRGSFFMVWPFLAIILYEKFALSASGVGLILTCAAVTSVVIGFLGGALSDKFGRKKVIYLSGVLYIFSFILLAQVDSLVGYIVVITLCSVAKELGDPPTSALIGDLVPDKYTRELAMQARYFVINVGAALGPMAGVWLGLTGQQSSFFITAIAFAVFLILLTIGFKISPEQRLTDRATHQQAAIKFRETIAIMSRDNLLLCLIIANMLCMFIYAQMDTSLVQYLTRANVPDLLILISSLIFTNAMVIISSQFFLLKALAKYRLEQRIQMGLGLLVVSQFWLALNPLHLFWGWVGAIAIMSLAEAILFPTMSVHLDRIAPDHLRGAYFGAMSFYSLGYALAPFGGGLILDAIGGQWLFFSGALLCFVVIYLYRILPNMSRPEFAKVISE